MGRCFALAFIVLFLISCGSDQPDSPMTHDVMKTLDKSRPFVSGSMDCKFASAHICNDVECRTGPNIIEVSWNPSTSEYRRCDKKGCDSYEPMVSLSDSYTILSFPENGMMTKISDRGDITEIATLMNTAFVKHGQCTSKPSQGNQSGDGQPISKTIDGKTYYQINGKWYDNAEGR